MKLSLKDRIDLVKNIDNSNTRINELVKDIGFVKLPVGGKIFYIDQSDNNAAYLFFDANGKVISNIVVGDYLIKNNSEAKSYFNKVVSFGEKYNTYSKENYYDIINCAYSWLVYYSFGDKDYKTTEKFCRKVLDNYLEVKDDPKYFVTEKESVDICNKYLEEIKKNS